MATGTPRGFRLCRLRFFPTRGSQPSHGIGNQRYIRTAKPLPPLNAPLCISSNRPFLEAHRRNLYAPIDPTQTISLQCVSSRIDISQLGAPSQFPLLPLPPRGDSQRRVSFRAPPKGGVLLRPTVVDYLDTPSVRLRVEKLFLCPLPLAAPRICHFPRSPLPGWKTCPRFPRYVPRRHLCGRLAHRAIRLIGRPRDTHV